MTEPQQPEPAAPRRPPAMSFDIADLPQSQRSDALVDAIDRAYFPCETRFLSTLRRGRMHGVEFGVLRAGYGEVDALVVERSPAMLRRDAGDYIFVPLPLREGVRLTQRGREAWIGPDSFACVATAEVYRYEQPRPLELFTLRIDAPAMRDRIAHIEDLAIRPLSAAGGPAALFLDYARAFCRNAPGFDRPTGDLAVRHLMDLLALTLLHLAPLAEASESAVRAAQHQQVQRHVEARLGDPGLGTERIARDLGMSERHLQKLFAAHGETLSGLIRQRRMAEAQRLLADPAGRSASIATIAYRLGFSDPAYFSRVFRDTTGQSPRQFRAEGRRSGSG